LGFGWPNRGIEKGTGWKTGVPKVKIPYAEIEAMMKREEVATS